MYVVTMSECRGRATSLPFGGIDRRPGPGKRSDTDGSDCGVHRTVTPGPLNPRRLRRRRLGATTPRAQTHGPGLRRINKTPLRPSGRARGRTRAAVEKARSVSPTHSSESAATGRSRASWSVVVSAASKRSVATASRGTRTVSTRSPAGFPGTTRDVQKPHRRPRRSFQVAARDVSKPSLFER